LQNIKNTISKKYSAISGPPVTGHEQQTPSYTLIGHRCNVNTVSWHCYSIQL